MLASLPYPSGGTVSNLFSILPSFGIYGSVTPILDQNNWISPLVYQASATTANDLRSSNYVCNNSILTLTLEVMYINTGSIASPAPAISGIAYRFGPPQRLIFSFDSKHPDSQLIELRSIVKFVNASSLNYSPKSGLPNRPPVAIKTWYDFFYLFFVES